MLLLPPAREAEGEGQATTYAGWSAWGGVGYRITEENLH